MAERLRHSILPASRMISLLFLTVGSADGTTTESAATTFDRPFPDDYANGHDKDKSAENTRSYEKYAHVFLFLISELLF